ncbi:uncharacterized protein P884DRAFT_265897 [Thermothelomyces heterothallicus CBS 202.75]|uniref:uncharacterized protein n=1 Tax=Thermothelomyces heterothallicus CBS 202.75 TaxID=1149848 RepID=UPI003744476F
MPVPVPEPVRLEHQRQTQIDTSSSVLRIEWISSKVLHVIVSSPSRVSVILPTPVGYPTKPASECGVRNKARQAAGEATDQANEIRHSRQEPTEWRKLRMWFLRNMVKNQQVAGLSLITANYLFQSQQLLFECRVLLHVASVASQFNTGKIMEVRDEPSSCPLRTRRETRLNTALIIVIIIIILFIIPGYPPRAMRVP